MKVLLTGGEGFIGSWTKQVLLDRGHTVLSLTNQKYADREQPEGVTVFLGDIRDEVTVTEAMAHSEGFIHLAGVLGTAETIFNPRPAARTNIIGGLNVSIPNESARNLLSQPSNLRPIRFTSALLTSSPRMQS